MEASERLRSGPGRASAVAAVCGLVLLLSLFLTWAQIVCVREPCQYPSGWEVLRVLDVPLALLAVAAIVLAFMLIFRPARLLSLLMALAGAIAIVLVFAAPIVEDRGVRPLDFGGFWFLGLLASLGIVASGATAFLSLHDFGSDEDGEDEKGDGEQDGGAEGEGEQGDGEEGEREQ